MLLYVEFKAKHQSKNPLRWIVNNIFHKISMVFFNKGIKISDKYEEKEIPASLFKLMNGYYILYKFFDKPYSKWGTHYQYTPDFKEEIDKEDY